MLAFTNADDKQSPTVVGAGCSIDGDITTDNTIQIHGHVDGNITADTVIIGRGATVVGKVVAETLFLHGTLEGPATVATANVFSNAKMVGTLAYCTLNITGNTGLECKLTKRNSKGGKNE
ncbi:MAG: polymer-forming cytoskeletal protein [Proteobacteria bacterium]|nr:polymer-forming cytoskeletal protein [Candidatus Enterousia scatequi]